MMFIVKTFIALVALMHVWFLVLEMFLWTKPLGLRTFGRSLAQAEDSAILAANQGLYNGFLAAGLIWGLVYPEPGVGVHIDTFFLICVIVAGAYGGYSVSSKIFFMQALPALVSLILLWTV
jgi:putative membrane protein